MIPRIPFQAGSAIGIKYIRHGDSVKCARMSVRIPLLREHLFSTISFVHLENTMTSEFLVLLWTAAAVGVVHTILGPDHYIPFAAMAKSGDWSRARTIRVTVLCGLGHIGSSVLLGLLGVALGWALGSMEAIERARGEWAAWGLIALGLTYGVWGVHRGLKNRPHHHVHRHGDGTLHAHDHGHHEDHAHVHESAGSAQLTPWVLFIAFVLGPCEPLIPLLIVPAMAHGWLELAAVVAVFGAATLCTMLMCVWILHRGISLVPLHPFERWSHAFAGFAVFACGGAMAWLGL